jgi:diaminohydroxyphosphoribosylaminopyrimidine deaminase/5-amino-6-(5-phosphoribosylamino)uracil reductase
VVPPMAAGTLLSEDVYQRAIELGRTAAGISGPNPPVGCVIVRDGFIVGEGATSVVGGPHAEVVALADAAGRCEQATVVVTLEPCAHHGRTAPCTDALIAAGVSEVHVLMRDPDPQAAGGADRLRAAGIRVIEVGADHPELAAQVAHDLRGFVARVLHGRPHVLLKLAQTSDGMTAAGPNRYLTGVEAQTHVHSLRSDVDAVLVGSQTVAVDDPQLDVRHVVLRVPAGQPRPVVLATEARVDPAAHVITRGALVLVGEDAPAARCEALAEAGATVVRVPSAPGGGRLDLQAVLAGLLDHRILTVLAEPGPTLASALLAQGLVDTVELHIAGGVGAAAVVPALAPLAPVVDAWRAPFGSAEGVVEWSARELGDDMILRATLGPSSTRQVA